MGGSKKNRKNKRNDQGYSLLELIVVIAILAIISAGVMYSFSTVTGYRGRQAAEVISQALSETKVDAMSKDFAYMEIYKDGDVYKLRRNGGGQEEVLGNKSVTISYDTGSGLQVLGGAKGTNQSLCISYEKGTGAFRPLLDASKINETTKTLETLKPESYCKEIVVTVGSRTRKLVLLRDTGKCEYDG